MITSAVMDTIQCGGLARTADLLTVSHLISLSERLEDSWGSIDLVPAVKA